MKNIPLHELNQDDLLVIERIESGGRINFAGIHRHNFFEILHFTSINPGDTHTIDFVEYPISPEQIYIVKPFQVYKMVVTNQRGFSFALTKDYFNSLQVYTESYINYVVSTVITPTKRELEAIKKVFDLILSEYFGKSRKMLLDVYMSALLLQLLSVCSEGDMANRNIIDKRIMKTLVLINKHFTEQHSTSFYARQVSLSEKRLNELAKKVLGFTVKQLILERLLLEAKRLISYGQLTFKEIAFELGFNDSAYFSRFFKMQSGLTPEQFKLTMK